MILNYLRSLLFSNAPLRSAPSDRRPTGAGLRNPADPVQAARIQAAVAKRERKAQKRQAHTNNSWSRNVAHHKAFYAIEKGHIAPLNRNPFYIAK